MRVEMIYNGSNPSAVTRSGSGTPDDPYFYSPDPEGGHIRIWANDESQQRDPASIGSGGDWVQPDETSTLNTYTGVKAPSIERPAPSIRSLSSPRRPVGGRGAGLS